MCDFAPAPRRRVRKLTPSICLQHAEGVESGKVTEPLKTTEEVRYTRSIFNGESILPKDLPKEEEKEP